MLLSRFKTLAAVMVLAVSGMTAAHAAERRREIGARELEDREALGALRVHRCGGVGIVERIVVGERVRDRRGDRKSARQPGSEAQLSAWKSNPFSSEGFTILKYGDTSKSRGA